MKQQPQKFAFRTTNSSNHTTKSQTPNPYIFNKQEMISRNKTPNKLLTSENSYKFTMEKPSKIPQIQQSTLKQSYSPNMTTKSFAAALKNENAVKTRNKRNNFTQDKVKKNNFLFI